MPEWTGTDIELEEEMLDGQQNQLEQEQRDYDEYVAWMKGLPGTSAEDYVRGFETADMINSPDHYTAGGIETIDVIRAKLTPEEFRGYLKGNALKYLLRANYKGKHNQDIHKADWYSEALANVTPEA